MVRTLRALALTVAVVAGLLVGVQPATATQFGLSDQQAATWSDSRVRELGFQHARLIVPFDAATTEPARVQAWLDAVVDAGLAPHIVFERKRGDGCPGLPCKLPTRAEYRAAVDAFIAQWPQVTTYTTWNEVNHFSQPVAKYPELVAAYWVELTQACPGCTIVAADMLDSGHFVRWVERFRAATPTTPRRWGLHNYADATYGTTIGTDKMLAAVPGDIWVEETGGIVTLRNRQHQEDFPTNEARAATAIDHAFAIARTRPRIKRMYLYHWKAHTFADFFDAGLVRPDGTPRESLQRVQTNLRLWSLAHASTDVTVTARWVRSRPGKLQLAVRCRAPRGECRGRVRVVVNFRRAGGSKLRSVRLTTGRSYRTTARRRVRVIELSVPRSIRRQLRTASSRRLAVTLRATSPSVRDQETALPLARPPQR